MNPDTLCSIFAAAWRGLAKRHADDDQRAERIRDRYLHRLREARTGTMRREVISELLAEGLIAAGGHDSFAGPDAVAALWASGEADDWASARDAALLAAGLRSE